MVHALFLLQIHVCMYSSHDAFNYYLYIFLFITCKPAKFFQYLGMLGENCHTAGLSQAPTLVVRLK